MKPFTKKLVESGVLDKHVLQMMRMWGTFDGSEATVEHPQKLKEMTQDQLQQFAEEIEDLLDKASEVKETRLEIPVVRVPFGLHCPDIGSFHAVEDEMGRLIVSPTTTLTRGAKIYPAGFTRSTVPWIVLDVEPLYQDDKLVAYQVTIDKPE